jgi:hypothetical protein
MNESSKLNEKIKILTKSHINNIEHTLNSKFDQKSSLKSLKNYFQNYFNSMETKGSILADMKTIDQQKTQPVMKKFDINWNFEYCKTCKLSYWPSNCQVKIAPKCHLTRKNLNIYKKYKFFNYKPRYNSYKQKLIKNIVKKGIKIFYKCKSCNQRNYLLNEITRAELNLKNNLKYKSFNIDQNNSKKPINNSKNLKKKFNSLQMKLKQDEFEMSNKNNSLNLSQFLEQFI